MDRSQLTAFVDAFQTEQRKLIGTKGREYVDKEPDAAGGNFRRIARGLGVDPRLVWAVYAQKHFDAIVASASTEGAPAPAEGMRGRFLDLATYCIVGAAMWQDMERAYQAEGGFSRKRRPIRIPQADEEICPPQPKGSP